MVLMLSLSMIFSGAVAAVENGDSQDPQTLNVTVLDENCDPVDEICNGSEVTTQIEASTCEDICDPYTVINVDPECGIEFDPYCAEMYDGQCWTTNDPNCNPFFYQCDDSWIWDMGDLMCAGKDYILKIPGIVSCCGPIDVTGDLYGDVENNNAPAFEGSPGCLLASDSYSFVSECNDPSVDVAVVDENGEPVDEVCTDDEIFTQVTASAGCDYVKDPKVKLYVDPKGILEFLPEEAKMWDGKNWTLNDPSCPFFYLEDGAWVWDIGCDMCPHDVFQLLVPTLMNDCGEITVSAEFFGCTSRENGEVPALLAQDGENGELLDSASYGFTAVCCDDPDDNGNASGAPEDDGLAAGAEASAADETVPMQTTGAPIALLVLALFAVLGGSVFGKLR